MKAFLSLKKVYPTLKDISSFNWIHIIDNMKKTMPTVIDTLEGLMPAKYPVEKR